MKILLLTKSLGIAGGVETYLIDLLPHLLQRGHEVVIAYYESGIANRVNVACETLLLSADTNESTRRLAEFVDSFKPDVAYVHDVYDPVVVEWVADRVSTLAFMHIFYPVCPGLGKLFRSTDEICARPFGIGCVPNIYIKRCASAKSPLSVLRIMSRTRAHLRAYEKPRKLVVASHYMAQLLVQNGIDPGRIAIIPYFVEFPDRLEHQERDRLAVLFAGRLEYEKGVPYLLRALAQLSDQYSLWIVGDGSRAGEYQELAADLHIAGRVEFLGWKSQPELYTLYQRASVTVMPTVMAEPFGKVGVEAMANACPVIAFDVGGIPEWLVDGTTGYLVQPRSIDALAGRLQLVLSNETLAGKLGSAGRRHVANNFVADRHMGAIVSLMEEVAN